MFAGEPPQAGPELGFLVLVFVHCTLRMNKESITDKVIFGGVVPTDKEDGQSPAGSLGIARGKIAFVLIRKAPFMIVPSPQMAVKATLRFLLEIEQERFDADFDRCFFVVEIAPLAKIMLTDHRAAVQALRTQNEIERLAHCRFTGVVTTGKQCVPGEINNTFGNAAKVLNSEPPDAYGLASH